MNQQMEELVIDHRNYNPYKPDGEIKAWRKDLGLVLERIFP
jgi:hypothetical protein